MTIDEAFDLISRYGNVTDSVQRLKNVAPFPSQLPSVRDAMLRRGRDEKEVNEAIMLAIEYHKLYTSLSQEFLQSINKTSGK